MYTFRKVFVFSVMTLLIGLWIPPQTHGNQALAAQTAPTYARQGPHQAGRSNFLIDKGTNNEIAVVMRYPAIIKDKGPNAAIDAAPDTAKAPYPLVVLSLGEVGSDNLKYLADHLASWGFVVLTSQSSSDFSQGAYPGIVRHLAGMKRTIKYTETLTAEGPLKGMIEIDHTAVGGWSLGGITAWGSGGATLNWAAVEQYCTENAATDKLDSCVNLATQKKAVQTLLGVSGSADGKWPAIWDERVKAIFPMAGTIDPYGKEGVSKITIPVLVMLAAADVWTPPAWTVAGYEQVSSTQKAMVTFEGGMHSMFADAVANARPDPSHPLIQHFTTAFLLDALKGDKEAHKALLPTSVTFSGLQYKATMK